MKIQASIVSVSTSVPICLRLHASKSSAGPSLAVTPNAQEAQHQTG